MEQKELISQIYKILLLYEDAVESKSNVTEDDYIRYLERIYVGWVGIGNREVCYILKGLKSLSLEAPHTTVKAMVFHIIGLIERGGIVYGI